VYCLDVKYSVVGHLVIDRVIRDGREYKSLGGAAAYASITAVKNNCYTNIISRVGEDFPDEYILFLARNGIDVSLVKRVKYGSTSYKLIYRDDDREIFLLSRCSSISPEDIPENFSSDIIHIGSVANEVPLNTFQKLCERGKMIVLDVQGFIRSVDDNGRIVYKKWVNAENFLDKVDIVHADYDEGKFITDKKSIVEIIERFIDYGVKIVLITLGRKGAYIGDRNSIFFIPSLVPERVVDETGAGDVYTTIFSLEYFIGKNIVEAASMAAGTVSFLVEEVGIYGIRPIDRCMERAREIMYRARKIL